MFVYFKMNNNNSNNLNSKGLNKLTRKASNAVDKTGNLVNMAKDSLKTAVIPFDFSLNELENIFGGLLTFPEFSKSKPLKDCEGELGYQKRRDELLEESIKEADDMANNHIDVGSYYTISPREESIFLKKQIKVDCKPIEPKINPNSVNKDENCWNTQECLGGLKCNNTEKYIQGVCVEDNKVSLSGENGACFNDSNCKDDLECTGNVLKNIFGTGICKTKVNRNNASKANNSNKTRKNRNNLANNAGFTGEA